MNEAKIEYNATLISRINITPRLTLLRVRPDSNDFSFKPGQYVALGLYSSSPRIPEATTESNGPSETLIRRAYSISSGSSNQSFLEFYISLVSSGELTPRLFALEENARLFIGPKAKGLFTIESVPSESHILMVATGTGLAPFMSMLRSNILNRPSQLITALHGARFTWDLGYRNELEELSYRCSNFQYLPVISEPEKCKNWNGMTGFLPPLLENPKFSETCGFSILPKKTHVFICGNPIMIEQSEKILKAVGFETKGENTNLHIEKY